MLVINSSLLNTFDEIRFGFSTKIGLNRTEPYNFNLSQSVGDSEESVKENRETFFTHFELETERVALQRQIHSDIIQYVDKGGDVGKSDALITDKKNIGLAMSSADCAAIFLYDYSKRIIAAVHSGWRGTAKNILSKTLNKLKMDFGVNRKDLVAFIGPSISKKNYEVGEEVAEQFKPKYLEKSGSKYLLNVKRANYDMLTKFGIPYKQIQVSTLCSYEQGKLLHSYRREGTKSGRALGLIVMR